MYVVGLVVVTDLSNPCPICGIEVLFLSSSFSATTEGFFLSFFLPHSLYRVFLVSITTFVVALSVLQCSVSLNS